MSENRRKEAGEGEKKGAVFQMHRTAISSVCSRQAFPEQAINPFLLCMTTFMMLGGGRRLSSFPLKVGLSLYCVLLVLPPSRVSAAHHDQLEKVERKRKIK